MDDKPIIEKETVKAVKVTSIGDNNESMILYAYSDKISKIDAVAWCKKLKTVHSQVRTTHHVLFDYVKNAIPPTNPISALF